MKSFKDRKMKRANKWKIAFWISFLLMMLSLFIAGVLFINAIDNALLHEDQRSSYEWTEEDLQKIISIINSTDLSKSQIEAIVEQDDDFIEGKTIDGDTIYLNRLSLIFKNGKLSEIKSQW